MHKWGVPLLACLQSTAYETHFQLCIYVHTFCLYHTAVYAPTLPIVRCSGLTRSFDLYVQEANHQEPVRGGVEPLKVHRSIGWVLAYLISYQYPTTAVLFSKNTASMHRSECCVYVCDMYIHRHSVVLAVE